MNDDKKEKLIKKKTGTDNISCRVELEMDGCSSSDDANT